MKISKTKSSMLMTAREMCKLKISKTKSQTMCGIARTPWPVENKQD